MPSLDDQGTPTPTRDGEHLANYSHADATALRMCTCSPATYEQPAERDPACISHGYCEECGRSTCDGSCGSDADLDIGELVDALGSRDGDQRAIAKVFVEAAVLCLRKNRDYGSSFRQPPALLPGLSAQDAVLVRIDDKDRRFSNLSPNSSGTTAESRLETMRDRACYSLLWCLLEEERLAGGES